MEKTIRIGNLNDWYGALLSDKQREVISMYYADDLSLTEIAAEMGISKQAVSEQLNRAEGKLLEYESILQLNKKQEQQQKLLDSIFIHLKKMSPADDRDVCIEKLQKLSKLLAGDARA